MHIVRTLVLAAVATLATTSIGCVPMGARHLSFNGRPATPTEIQLASRLPDGDYWYDATSGALGQFGGPALAIVPAGLALGGPLPANASGGGDGSVTGVFVNGRELHPIDVARLRQIVGNVQQGRWTIYANGDVAPEGGAVLGNLYAAAQAANGGGGGNGGGYRQRIDGGVVISDGQCGGASFDGYTVMTPGC